jgi:AcrR family transcriptional regulator
MPVASLQNRVYRGMPAEARRAERRERLVEAGLEVFGTRGYHRTTVRDVCSAARLTERYFYESFRGREDLIVAVFEKVAGEVAERIVAAVIAAPRKARELARAAATACVLHLTDDPRRARLLLIEAAGASEALDRRRREMIQEYAGVVRKAAREFFGNTTWSATDARLSSLAVVAAIAELIMEWQLGSLHVSRERLIEHCIALILAAGRTTSEPRSGSEPGPARSRPGRDKK